MQGPGLRVALGMRRRIQPSSRLKVIAAPLPIISRVAFRRLLIERNHAFRRLFVEREEILTNVQPEVEGGSLRQRDFADFYRLRREPIYRALAMTLRDRDIAADAVEEAMARAYERWRSVSGYANQEGWTYRVGLNWAISRGRKARREIVTDRLPDQASEDRLPDPDLDRVIGELTVQARAVVVLRHYLDMSYEEIGQALQIPAGTAKSRLHYATEEMRRLLEVTQ